ncbi:MAG: NAD(P)-dependent oxidoreductase [Candidatus Saccharibacteria bacterium]|nr:NAD(P)-dependent oxidoreductase [Moraxellaceae bacterium]
MNIAFLGMGLMGSRMSLRLLNAGFAVHVWNRTSNAAGPLIAQGAQPLTNLDNLSSFQIIALCLANDEAIQSVTQTLLENIQPHQIIIDFSSSSVELTQTLAAQAHAKGAHWIDAPVSGGVMGAEQGTLVIFAGGDGEVIQQLSPFFAPLSQRVTHMGNSGSGQATKICNQLIVAATSTLIAEAIALAAKSGVDTTLLAPALAGGFADSKPFQILAPRMATQNFEPVQWKVQTLKKDLTNAIQLATTHGLTLPVADRALQQLHKHTKNGFATNDLSSIIKVIES